MTIGGFWGVKPVSHLFIMNSSSVNWRINTISKKQSKTLKTISYRSPNLIPANLSIGYLLANLKIKFTSTNRIWTTQCTSNIIHYRLNTHYRLLSCLTLLTTSSRPLFHWNPILPFLYQSFLLALRVPISFDRRGPTNLFYGVISNWILYWLRFKCIVSFFLILRIQIRPLTNRRRLFIQSPLRR